MPDEEDEVTVEDANADTDQPDAPDWDLTPVAKFLTARSETAAEAAWVDALPAISERFSPDAWGYDHTVNPYGQGAHSNLYNVEGQREFRNWLEGSGVSVADYAEAVGPIQYVSIQIHLLSLGQRLRNNKGWRVRIMGFPSLRIIACGLGSHYQGTQNHNQMGRASELIRAQALEVLTSESRQALDGWPSATSDDWEERGLMANPVLMIGNLDISSFDEGRGAKLRMIRNTTVKKELATFFAIKGMTAETFISEGPVLLDTLRRVALDLGRTASR
ncbi:hypothetical protein [Mycolicibacterium poriferae]|uniref:hypothetical protein n=1 Tax=Mycolicibacterium poriferae TaxID=39694 RepID=UPI0024BBBB3F|nr:hypothetical protein [Mycolicibacterium poriferae]